VKGEETIDELRRHGLRIIQPRHGYRFSLDPLLLCDFSAIREGEEGIDLGAGCGVIPLILARSAGGTRLIGVESQESMAELATRNVVLNGLSDRVVIRHSDVLHVKDIFQPSSFDLVVANPPYRKKGSGRISPKQGRDIARHESTASIADFLASARYLVKLTGRICFIFHPSRMTEFLINAAGLKLAATRLRMVHGSAESDASMFLVEMVKGRKADMRVLPPLFVYDADGEYSEEMVGIFGEVESRG
jgi:tRNA1Val (adenine37-N6)-methyltransferase